MKKLVLTTVCALAAGVALAQNNLTWQSFAPTAIKVETNSTIYSPLFGGGSTGSGVEGFTDFGVGTYYYQLLYLPGSQTGAPSSLSTIIDTVNGTGWFDASTTANAVEAESGGSAGTIAAVTSSPAVPAAWNTGTTDNIVLVGWSANLGTTWLQASNALANWSTDKIANAFFGASVTGYITPTTSSPGGSVFGTSGVANGTPISAGSTSGNYMVLDLLPVPEPTSMVLAGLGGLSMLLLRRRK